MLLHVLPGMAALAVEALMQHLLQNSGGRPVMRTQSPTANAALQLVNVISSFLAFLAGSRL